MVPNPNYVLPSMATPPPPTIQQPTSRTTPTPVTDAATSKSSHGSEATADAPPPPPIVKLRIWPDGSTRLIWNAGYCFLVDSCLWVVVMFLPNPNACTQEMTTSLDPATRRSPLRLGRAASLLQLYFIWDVEHDLTIRKIFDHRMGRRHQQMLDDVLHGWDHRIASSRSSKYTGGSATFMKAKDRLLKSLDREATFAETFKYTHTLKENKAGFANQRSRDHYRLGAMTQQSQQIGEDAADGSAASAVDPDVVCHETASVPYKNRVYGVGSFFTSSLRTSTLRLHRSLHQ
ncbi:hypothetical protein Ahy_A03g010166 [Arachis hypogaea]|uniref:Uncharacterized protein n=1 Tax=Arachis hypogaea TaxID=3818 RepID=A0A445DLB0_ARAHY|nr:hypothetical protein Ahy_A03g010166 [Arachis hypogaea]